MRKSRKRSPNRRHFLFPTADIASAKAEAKKHWKDVSFRVNLTGRAFQQAERRFVDMWVRSKNPTMDVRIVKFSDSLPRIQLESRFAVQLACGHIELWRANRLLIRGHREAMVSGHLPIVMESLKCETCRQGEEFERRLRHLDSRYAWG